MKIRYLGDEKEKSVQTNGGRVYTFKEKGDVQDIEEKELQDHLLKKCGDRFKQEGEEVKEPPKKKGK